MLAIEASRSRRLRNGSDKIAATTQLGDIVGLECLGELLVLDKDVDAIRVGLHNHVPRLVIGNLQQVPSIVLVIRQMLRIRASEEGKTWL